MSSGSAFRRCISFGTHSSSNAPSAASRVYWYCVRLIRSSMVRSCTGCIYRVMPGTFASSGCRRRMMSEAWILRTESGFRLISMRPLLRVTLLPSTPMNDDRLSTAGSRSTTLASAC